MHGRPKTGTTIPTVDEVPNVGQDRQVSLDREQLQTARERQRAIGRELRRMYNDIVHEPVPDDFYELLQKIDDNKTGGKGKQ
jgi:hypothetical protein